MDKPSHSCSISGYRLVDTEIISDMFKGMKWLSCEKKDVANLTLSEKRIILENVITRACSTYDFNNKSYSSVKEDLAWI